MNNLPLPKQNYQCEKCHSAVFAHNLYWCELAEKWICLECVSTERLFYRDQINIGNSLKAYLVDNQQIEYDVQILDPVDNEWKSVKLISNSKQLDIYLQKNLYGFPKYRYRVREIVISKESYKDISAYKRGE